MEKHDRELHVVVKEGVEVTLAGTLVDSIACITFAVMSLAESSGIPAKKLAKVIEEALEKGEK